MFNIPLSVPSFSGNEWKYVKKCIDTEWVSTAGSYVEKFEREIADYVNSKYAISCVNGTSALQLSLKLVGVLPGDEVIIPALTFIAPVNAISYNGAKPIFMDSDKYHNIDIEKTIDFIKKFTFYNKGFTYNKKTKNKISAIIPVHVWGNAVWLEDLLNLCEDRNINIIEDASESLGTHYKQGNYKGKHTGTTGKLGCLSFNGNKIITTGGGGMILTDNYELSKKAKYLSMQAKDDPVNYIHNEIGYNFRLNNIQAALGLAQLEQLGKILDNKKNNNSIYTKEIKKIEGLNILKSPDYSKSNYWLNILEINQQVYNRNPLNLMERLKKKGIQSRPVWKLNHLQVPYKNCFSFKVENAPKLIKNSLCIPSSSKLSKDEIYYIISSLKK